MKKIEKDFILKDLEHINNEITIKMQKLNSIVTLFMEEEINIIEEQQKEKNKKDFEEQQKVVLDDDEIDNNTNNEPNTDNVNEEIINEIEDNTSIELPSDIKMIYRKIVMITHPDKNKDNYNSELYTDYYKRSVKPKSDNDISEIIYIAYKLNINEVYDIGDEYFIELKVKMNQIKEKSNNIDMNSFWVWYHTDNVKLKRMMVEQISKLR